MSETKFIGRGEELFRFIFQRLFNEAHVYAQVELKTMISRKDYDELDPIYQKHKFDYVIYIQHYDKTGVVLAVEVNYHHTAGVQRKWWNVFKPLLKKNHSNIIPVTIDDWDCRHLFTLTKDKEHKLKWDDFRDVIDNLEKAGVKIK